MVSVLRPDNYVTNVKAMIQIVKQNFVFEEKLKHLTFHKVEIGEARVEVGRGR